MNKNFTYLLTFLCLNISLPAQTIYVNHAATGMDNGSSWANAYPDLQEAIDNASIGSEIWVAQGTYYPGGTNPVNTSFFAMKSGVSLYGGFTGSETILAQRDFVNNITRLSGDILDDDIVGNVTDNRSDNTYHIMFIDSTATNSTMINGFVMSGGHGVEAASFEGTGGAILIDGSPTIKNIIFEDNFSFIGGALAIGFENAENIKVKDCTFTNNHSSGNGGAITVFAAGGTIKNCTFNGNVDQGFGGGAIRIGSSDVEIINCTFEGNRAFFGGALMIDSVFTAPNVTINNCSFLNNQVVTAGGGIYFNKGVRVSFYNSVLNGNEAEWGGAFLADSAKLNIYNCDFIENQAYSGGGASLSGFGTEAKLSGCFFHQNTAGWGGALYCQNDQTSLEIDSSSFLENITMGNGGAIHASRGIYLHITETTIDQNEASRGGGISYITNNSNIDDHYLNIENSIISNNVSADQGGGINLENANAHIINTLINNNVANSTGTGGAISNNASGSNNSVVTLMNSTLVNNSGALASGIAQWDDGSSIATLELQNTILSHSTGVNYAIEAGTPIVVSNGGNLSSDGSFVSDLTLSTDQNNADPLFEDATNQNYHLTVESPAINAGVNANAPPLDLEGLPRVDNVDIGAYEYQLPVSIIPLAVKENNGLRIFPNPVVGWATLELHNNWSGNIAINVSDMSGKVIQVWMINKVNLIHQKRLSLQDLPAGNYQIIISQKDKQQTIIFGKL